MIYFLAAVHNKKYYIQLILFYQIHISEKKFMLRRVNFIINQSVPILENIVKKLKSVNESQAIMKKSQKFRHSQLNEPVLFTMYQGDMKVLSYSFDVRVRKIRIIFSVCKQIFSFLYIFDEYREKS